jgi:hypothetical protein
MAAQLATTSVASTVGMMAVLRTPVGAQVSVARGHTRCASCGLTADWWAASWAW